MEFGTYIWAQPPHTLTVRHSRKTELTVDEQGTLSLQDFGNTGRTVQAEGKAIKYTKSIMECCKMAVRHWIFPSVPIWGRC